MLGEVRFEPVSCFQIWPSWPLPLKKTMVSMFWKTAR
jgi:hypothetical protein